MPRLFMHRENSVFKVETARGAAALRLHRPGYHSKTAIESELQWMAHLAANGLQVPQPLPTRHGSYLAEIDDGGTVHIVDLLSWLEGEPLGNSTDPLAFGKSQLQQIFASLGATIARMHDVSDQWAIPQGFTRQSWDRDGFVGENAFWGKFWLAGGLDAEGCRLLQHAREKAAGELDALRQAGADYGLIHADFVRQNILVTGADVRIIDFDDSGFGFRMYDFATALVKNRAEPHYDTMKAALFEGYRLHRSLSDLDERSFDFFLTLRDFAYLGWLEDRQSEPGVAGRLPAIRNATLAVAREFLRTPPVV